MTDAMSYILQLNKKLVSDNKLKLLIISKKSTDKYFDSMRIVFQDFLKAMSLARSDDERRVLILEMCDINALYSIKLKLGRKLPADLGEIAYDFDNPDYPGVANISDKIKHKQYLIQME
jgi:hypothetical protein